MSSLPVDRRTHGRLSTLDERGVDLERLRCQRLAKVQEQMQARDIAALLLTDPVNIRYVTGVSVMTVWSTTNLAHYLLVPASGGPVCFEFAQARFRAADFFPQVRDAHPWQTRFAANRAVQESESWAAEIADVLAGWGARDDRVGVDVLDYHGFAALQAHGIRLTDADETVQAARMIKTADEVELLKQSAAVAEAALHDLEQAVRPGVSEHELLAVFYHRMIALGGEHCFSRLLSTGHRTNPWFHEAGGRLVRPGDLVAFDTDMTGPEGYACDTSRTFLCGDIPTPAQREAYQVAHAFVQEVAARLRPGLGYAELVHSLPAYPECYRQQRYPYVLHAVGVDDETPFLLFPDASEAAAQPEGTFEENMVVSVEFYAGKVGEQDGVKLEDEVLITADGPVLLSLYPYEARLLT